MEAMKKSFGQLLNKYGKTVMVKKTELLDEVIFHITFDFGPSLSPN
jgi:hypothetical protein